MTVAAEFDIFVSPTLLVTIHYSPASHLEELFNEVASDAALKERVVGRGPAYLLYRILDHLFEVAFPMLDHIVEHLERVEERIFAGHEREMVTEILRVQRDLAGFRNIVRPQRHLYEAGTLQGEWGSPAFAVVFRSVHGKLSRLWDHLETLWERIATLAQTNSVLVDHKLNEFVKILTVLGAFFLPLGLVAQVVTFLHGGIPLLNRLVFWSIIAVMLLVVYIVLWRARRRKIL